MGDSRQLRWQHWMWLTAGERSHATPSESYSAQALFTRQVSVHCRTDAVLYLHSAATVCH